MELSGVAATGPTPESVGATGPGYGVKIVTLYDAMLRHAASRQAAGLR